MNDIEDKNGEKSFDGMVLTVTSRLFFEKIQSTMELIHVISSKYFKTV